MNLWRHRLQFATHHRNITVASATPPSRPKPADVVAADHQIWRPSCRFSHQVANQPIRSSSPPLTRRMMKASFYHPGGDDEVNDQPLRIFESRNSVSWARGPRSLPASRQSVLDRSRRVMTVRCFKRKAIRRRSVSRDGSRALPRLIPCGSSPRPMSPGESAGAIQLAGVAVIHRCGAARSVTNGTCGGPSVRLKAPSGSPASSRYGHATPIRSAASVCICCG